MPDTFQNLMVLPVTPDICAAVNHPDGTISQAEVSLVNQGAVGLHRDTCLHAISIAAPAFRPRSYRVFRHKPILWFRFTPQML